MPKLHIKSPLIPAGDDITKSIGVARVFYKLDNLQPSGSFKIRGIGHLLSTLAANLSHKPEVVSSSGGNAGMASAWAASKMGLQCRVFVPITTSSLTVQRLQKLGAVVIVGGSVWDEANAAALEYCRQKQLEQDKALGCSDGSSGVATIMVHPFDNPLLWEGHSTMMEEVRDELPSLIQDIPNARLDAVVCSVGGGGLLGGVMTGLLNTSRRPTIVAVETEGAASFAAAAKSFTPGQPFDGVAAITSIAKSLGALKVADGVMNLRETYGKDQVVSSLVTDKQAINAVLRFANEERMLVEPACGAALATVFEGNVIKAVVPRLDKDSIVVVVVCGGSNVSVESLAEWQMITVTPPTPEFASESSTASNKSNLKVKLGPDSGNTVSASQSKARELINEHDQHWPQNIVDYLCESLLPTPEDTPMPPKPPTPAPSTLGRFTSSSKTPAIQGDYIIDPVAMSPTVPCEWANPVVARFFLALRESQLFKSRMAARFAERMNLKLQGNSFISHVRMLEITLGDYAPKIHGLRLMKGVMEDLAVVLELDVTYQGGGSVAIETTLTGGLCIPVRVVLSKLSGKLRVRFPSVGWPDMLAIAFVEDPGATFVVDSAWTVRDNEYLRGMVNKILSGIMRKTFLDMWVLPSWRHIFLPLMIPSPAEELARMNIANIPKPPVHRRPGAVATTEAPQTLWEGRAAAHKTPTVSAEVSLPKQPDLFVQASLPLTTVVSYTWDMEKLNSCAESLITPFIVLAKDSIPDKSIGKVDSERVSIASEVQSKGPIVWKSVRNKGGVNVQKGKKSVNGQQVEFSRAIISINCDAERVFSILSNPDHIRQMEESFSYSTNVKQFGEEISIKHYQYAFSKTQTKDYFVFEVAKKLRNALPDDSGSQSDSYIVVLRSIDGYEEDAESMIHLGEVSQPKGFPEDLAEELERHEEASGDQVNEVAEKAEKAEFVANEATESTKESKPALLKANMLPAEKPSSLVFVAGYLIEAETPTTCTVIQVTQLSSDINKLEANHNSARKLKLSVEEYINLSSGGSYGPNGSPQSQNSAGLLSRATTELRRRFITPETSGDASDKKVDRLKNMVGSAAGYLMKRTRFGSVSAGPNSVDGSYENEYENTEEGVGTKITGDISEEPGSHVALISDSPSIHTQNDQAFESDTISLMTSKKSGRDTPSLNSSSTAGTQSIMSRVGDVVHGDLMTSAASIAKAVSKRRSFTFLKQKDGSQPGSSEGETSENQNDMPFSIGNPIDFVSPTEKKVVGKDIIKHELQFNPKSHDGGVELVWDFFMKGDPPVLFSLTFSPDRSAAAAAASDSSESHQTNYSALFPESAVDRGDRQIVPSGTVTATAARSYRGSFSVTYFPKGKFVFTWDSTTNAKKAVRELVYRAALRSYSLKHVPRTFNMSVESIGEFGFGGATSQEGRHCSGFRGDVFIPRKSLYRLSLVYDPSLDSTQEEYETSTYLAWDFSTNGLDIFFGVMFYPFDGLKSSPATIPSSSHHQLDAAAAQSDNVLVTQPKANPPPPPIPARPNGPRQDPFAKITKPTLTDDDHSAMVDLNAPHFGEETVSHEEREEQPQAPPSGGLVEGDGLTAAAADVSKKHHETGHGEQQHSETPAKPMLPPRPGQGVAGVASPPPKPPRRGGGHGRSSDKLDLAGRLAAVVNSHEERTTPPVSPRSISSDTTHTLPLPQEVSSTAQVSSDSSPGHCNTERNEEGESLGILSASQTVSSTISSSSTTTNTITPTPTPTPTPIPQQQQQNQQNQYGLSTSPSAASTLLKLTSHSHMHHVKPIHVVPVSKVKSTATTTYSGTLPITGRKGVYNFLWDNSHSVVLPKIVSFRVGMIATMMEAIDDESSSPVEERQQHEQVIVECEATSVEDAHDPRDEYDDGKQQKVDIIGTVLTEERARVATVSLNSSSSSFVSKEEELLVEEEGVEEGVVQMEQIED